MIEDLSPEDQVENLEELRQIAPTYEDLALLMGYMTDAVAFYADPQQYHAIWIQGDRPCGAFADDVGEVEDYDRPMPGQLARDTLAKCFPPPAEEIADE